MGLYSDIKEAFKKRYFANAEEVKQMPDLEVVITPEENPEVELFADDNPKKGLAVKGGRESEPEHSSIYSILTSDKKLVSPEIPKDVFDTIVYLAKYNSDISYAIENVISLGNTDYDIYFDDSISSDQARKLVEEFRSDAEKWYNGGIHALRGDLLGQVAITGAVSSEMIIMPSLRGMDKVVLVNPKNIEFGYDSETNEYIPYQRVSNLIKNSSGLRELNRNTYKYVPVRRYSEKPYAVPPFLSALESLVIERDMISGFKKVVGKMNIMGFLHALVTAPKPYPNEPEDKYRARCLNYLQTMVVPELQKGVNSGIVAGFEGIHKFEIEGNKLNVSGAKELIDMITQFKMAGLKQDPRMLGRDFSTTETYGAVIMKKFSQQLTNYQKAVDQFLSEVFFIHAILKGYKVKYVQVVSKRPMLNDEKLENEAYKLRIENAKLLYDQGIIDQNQFAQEVGYDKAAEDGPRQMSQNQPDPTQTQNMVDSIDVLEAENQLRTFENEVYTEEYDYGMNCDCSDHKMKLNLASVGDSELDALIKKYFGQIQLGYKRGIMKVLIQVGNSISKLGSGATEQQVVDSILHAIFVNWEKSFTKPQEAVIAEWVSKIHKTFRGNVEFIKGVPGFDPSKPPKAAFGILDARVQEYYKKSDRVYLGKFITDEDTKKKMTEFIREQYIAKNMPIGKDINSSGMKLFKDQFGNILQGEEWKIARIINTTANTMRNTAGVMYMKDSSATRFMVVGVKDGLQCSMCQSLQGKEFSVSNAVNQIESLVSTSPSNIGVVKPFITSQYKPDEIEKLSQEELDKLGLIIPAHANCRDTIVAKL